MKTNEKKEYLFSKKALAGLVIPLMIDLTLTLTVGMIDSIMVASIGEDAVSGVSLVDTVMQLLILVFGAFGTGGAVVSGQYLGAGDQKTACRTTTELIWFAGLISLLFMAGMYGIKGLLLGHLFGRITPAVYAHADAYFLMAAASIPAPALYQAGAAVFRAMGQAGLTMKLSLAMNLMNVTGNALFIYQFRWGTFGAALSTAIARCITAAVAVYLLLDERRVLHLRRSLRYRPDWKLVKKILSIGIPNGVENGLFQLGKIMVLSLVSRFGTAAIAANSIATTLAGIECIPGKSMELACTTVIARCVGAKDEKQTRFYNKVILALAYGFMAVISALLCLFLPRILGLYHLSGEAYNLTSRMVIMHSIGGALIWPLSFVLPSALRAAGDVRFAMTVSVISMWIFRIGGSYLLALHLGFGAIGVWIAMQCDWVFRSSWFIWRWISGRWKGKSIIEEKR